MHSDKNRKRFGWTKQEHQLFVGAVRLYGKNYIQIAEKVRTKTVE